MIHHAHDPIIEDAAEWTDEEQDPSQYPDPHSHSPPLKIAPMKSLHQFHQSPSEDVEDVSNMDNESTLNGESAIDRLIALKYMLPLSMRMNGYRLFVGFWRVWKRVWSVAGAASWVVTTSLILVGLPMFIEYDREQGMMAFEKEQQKADQLL